MNFFAQQARARTNTARLVIFFALAIISLIILTQCLVVLVFCWTQGIPVFSWDSFLSAIDIIGGKLFWSIAAVIICIVLLAYFYKAIQLSGGGRSVAEAMGGRLINTNTRDADEKKILNVVEEMAIASGTPVPPVYLINDPAINAFAAGLTPQDAVIGITSGCIHIMNRNELQGIIAHEFSHIFNGDMRMNIRLVSILHGILVIGMLGHIILRSLSRNRTAWGSSRHSRNSAIPSLFILGSGLYAIGYAGTFFGNLIKAAVSRQREFLADASAVQFTRNPDGIGGALKKIGGYALGSRLETSHADEFSHFFFSEGISKAFTSLMATHPPLAERIRCIDRRWDGHYPHVSLPEEFRDEVRNNPDIVKATAAGVVINRAALPVSNAVDSIGKPSPEHLDVARDILGGIPESLSAAAHEPYSARALVYCLLLDRNHPAIHAKQIAALEQHASHDTFAAVMAMQAVVKTLDIRYRLPLIDLCLPSLKQLSPAQAKAFRAKLLALIKADTSIDLFEWSLYRMVMHHLEPPRNIAAPLALPALQTDLQLLISAVALQSSTSIDEAARQFDKGWSKLGLPAGTLDTNILGNMARLDLALKRAARLHPLKKPQLIKACCATLPDHPAPTSIELIRAIGDGLDAPIPPLLQGQTLV